MPVNVDAINATIARIRQNQNFKFNMNDWGSSGSVQTNDDGHFCGTSACIAGFAVLTAHPESVYKINRRIYVGDGKYDVAEIDAISGNVSFAREGAEILGLTRSQANALFLPDGRGFETETGQWKTGPDFYSATEDQGIAVLEHLRDTGIVDWTVSGIKSVYPDFEEEFEKKFRKTLSEDISVAD